MLRRFPAFKGLAQSISRPMTAAAKTDMFCFQCEQTEHGTGCTTVGVCGKTPETAALQDLLVEAVKGVSVYANASAELGSPSNEALDKFTMQALFSTLTNVNFDADAMKRFLKAAKDMETVAKDMYTTAGGKLEDLAAPAWEFSDDTQALVAQGKQVGVMERRGEFGADVSGLMELCTYGIKGLAAYAEHASQLGKTDPEVGKFVHHAMSYLAGPKPDLNELVALALKTGEVNINVMSMLDNGHTTHFGHPEPSPVNLVSEKGKCILVSGHDLHDLEALLKQTEGKGINVYTHGEMLPAHGYPGLKKYAHLKGNYGGAWQLQKFDFAMFPGPILLTSNCLVEPRKAYADRIYTTNVVGFPGVPHLAEHDYGDLIEKAQSCKGFTGSEKHMGPKEILTGFGHNAVISIAGDVVEAVQAGKLKHFFFIGGCDGSEAERSYFKDLAVATPNDTAILTAGCGKYRFNKLELGNVGETGIPRVLDVGQCNDSFGAIQIASALAGAFKTDVNGLPLSFAVSWFEQKAVAVLLSLLHLGVQDIRLGPNLPAFVTPTVLGVLVENFNIKPIGDPAEDLKSMLQNK